MAWRLDWTTTDATSVDIDNGVGVGLPPNGSAVVNPVVTTTYNMIAYGPGGTDTDNVTIIVPGAAPGDAPGDGVPAPGDFDRLPEP